MSRHGPGANGEGDASWERMLRATPVHNAAATADRRSGGELCLTVPRRRPGYLVALSWLIRPQPTRTVVLDRLGAQIWQNCNGQRTVEQVVDAFATEHRLSFHEARAAVTGYLKDLIERGAVAIVMPRTPGSAPGSAPGSTPAASPGGDSGGNSGGEGAATETAARP